MIRFALLLAFCLPLTACGSDEPGTSGPADQSNPRALAESVFAAARSENYAALKGIASPSADGDCKRIAGVGEMEPDKQAEFKKYFELGKVTADPTIKGDKATVPITFGPKGNKEEQFEMVLIDGKWFLDDI